MRRFCILILLILTMLAGCGTNAFDEAMRAGEEAFALGDYEVAVASFEEALALEPENTQAVIALDGAKHRVEDQRWNSDVNAMMKEVDRLKELASEWNNLSEKAAVGEISHNAAINRMSTVLVPRMSEISVKLMDMRDDIVDELGVAGEVFCIGLNDVTAMLSDVVNVVDNSELAKVDSFEAYPEIRSLLLMQDKLKGIQDVHGDLTDYKVVSLVYVSERYMLAGIQRDTYRDSHFLGSAGIDWYALDLVEGTVDRVCGDYRLIHKIKSNSVWAIADGSDIESGRLGPPKLHVYDFGTGERRTELYWASWPVPGYTVGHVGVNPLKIRGLQVDSYNLIFNYDITEKTVLVGGGFSPYVRVEDRIVLDFYDVKVDKEVVVQIQALDDLEYINEVKTSQYVDVLGRNHLQVKLTLADNILYTCGCMEGNSEHVFDFCVKLKHK